MRFGRGVWLGAACAVAVAAVLAGLLLWFNSTGSSQKAAALPAMRPLQLDPAFDRVSVVSVSGNSVVLDTGAGQRTLALAQGTRVEALQPATADSIAVGDFVVVGGAPNLVYPFAVKSVVVIPAAEADAGAGGPPRSRGGFDGLEANPDAAQGPELYGRVESVANGALQVSGPLGTFSVSLQKGAPLRRLTAGGVELIHGGDRLALPAGSASPGAVLDLPGS